MTFPQAAVELWGDVSLWLDKERRMSAMVEAELLAEGKAEVYARTGAIATVELRDVTAAGAIRRGWFSGPAALELAYLVWCANRDLDAMAKPYQRIEPGVDTEDSDWLHALVAALHHEGTTR